LKIVDLSKCFSFRRSTTLYM